LLTNPIVFSGNSNLALAEKVSAYLNVPKGDSVVRYFSDGEIWARYNVNIRGADVFILQSTNPPANNLMELLIMVDAAKRASAERITAVIPYFGYARQDRKDQPRVAITAKLVANLLVTAGVDRILTMDLHTPQLQGFFDIPVDHLYSATIFADHFREMKINDLTVLSPDVGGITMARAYAKRLGAPLAIIDKRRPKHNSAEIVNIIGDIAGRNILMIDDIVDTAGTLCNAAQVLRERGAQDIYVACTHPLLSGEAVTRIAESPIKKIIVADTVDLPARKSIEKIDILTTSALFGEAVKRIHSDESISSLFD